MSASTASTATSIAHAVPTQRPCYKHSARRWLASCDACTAWHLGRQIAARDAADTPVAPGLTLVPSTHRRPAATLRTAA